MGKLPLFVFGLLAVTCVLGVDVVVPEVKVDVVGPITAPPKPSSTTDAPQTSTEPTKPTTPTTKKPTTPTTTPSTTTKPSTTTPSTTTSTTTTPKPTTPSTTTTKPTPTTTVPPTPSPKPPSPPSNVNPPTGDWRVNMTVNSSCIIAEMAIQLELPYLTKDNKTWHAFIDIPKNATASGKCGVANESLTLTWPNATLSFSFKNNNKSYVVDKVTINVTKDEKNFPNMAMNSSKSVELVLSKALFNTTEKMSYKCVKVQTYNLTKEAEAKTQGYFHISHLRLQAFSPDKTTGFFDAIDCEPAGTPDIVPIAAGCALAALIVIVLGAYLIGRRRSQARGYLSMFTETKREEDYIPMKNLSCFN